MNIVNSAEMTKEDGEKLVVVFEWLLKEDKNKTLKITQAAIKKMLR